MSFDQFPAEKSDQFQDATRPPAGSPDDPTAELGWTSSTTEWRGDPVSFIRESWLLPPPARLSRDGDTDLLPVIGTGEPMSRSGRLRRLTMGLAVLAIAVLCCFGYLAVHNANVAAKWHQRAVAQVALTQKLSDQLKRANDHITTLDGTVGSLQGQLATVTRKENANSGLAGALRRLLWPFG